MARDGRKTLAGRRIVVTRSPRQSEELARRLEELGAEVLLLPMVQFRPLENTSELDKVIRELPEFDWLLFTSANAVQFFIARCRELGRWPEPSLRIAVVGPATRDALQAEGLEASLAPREFRAAELAHEIEPEIEGRRILLPRSDQAGEELPTHLRRAGAIVSDVVAYTNAPAELPTGPEFQSLLRGEADAVTFFSPSAFRHFANLFGLEALYRLNSRVALAAVGPITAAAIRGAGLPVTIQAGQATTGALVAALEQHFQAPAKKGEGLMFPAERPRRLRRTELIRSMVRETRLSTRGFIYPMFVCPGSGVRDEISSMPGVHRQSPDCIVEECKEVESLGIPSVMLFGIPEKKDERGSEAWSPTGAVQRAIEAIRRAKLNLVVMTDVCLCEYTDHGHCGLIENGEVANDATLPLLADEALSHARAGADMIAPSDMMDGRVAVIRKALDGAGFTELPILAYAAKYSSGFYGPFREAAQSAPQFGDRRSYQMDPANAREALREVQLDLEEGADLVMVKPALAYLDIIRRVRERFDVPVAAYNVSGEYAMVKAAVRNGWLEEQRVVTEILTAIQRAGADMILTYHAKDVARWQKD